MAAGSNIGLAIGLSVGGAFIGAGLCFGLRARPGASSGEISTAPSAGLVSQSAPVAPAAMPGVATRTGSAPASPPPVAPTADASAEISRQLEAQRARLRDKCWAPSVARTPLPNQGAFVYEYTFDASGTQRARGISPATRTDRPEVAFCLTGETATIAIAPPGATVHMKVPFTFP